ncbi:MAG TPA: glutamate--tRNA ligase [Caldithrix abyssi]|uniref:Glutamate--tRNA ligase n=1 Tax=Caldithrix abyssi TaxID=187145 RepID=A0A7V5VEJ2_CALAY|nr:glutamate--tRNA ligase [Caldithrix abyssi]
MSNTVRVRFAPSPTGYVHIGSLRTALYNYLFARKNKGVNILRIEDTDRNRLVEGAVENLLRTMEWAGIDFDESVEKGGPFGPYRQSERLDIYKKHIDLLLEKGHAYYCFATAEELDEMRRQQEARGEAPKYDGRYRDYPRDQARRRVEQGEAYVVRMRVPDSGETRFRDVVRGEVAFQNDLLDDQVLLKGDGFPTYHLANVVDDHLMGVTHVIRGEEWLPSTPKHVLLYRFFGWEMPRFAHLPLLLNADRSKLSKRQGDVAVEDYIKKGYLPQALVNFVALLGWNPGEDRELFSMDDLTEAFRLEKVNKAGAVFDVDKLNWMNGQYLREMDTGPLTAFLKPFFEQAGLDVSDPQVLEKMARAVAPRINKGEDVAAFADLLRGEMPDITEAEALEILNLPDTTGVLQRFVQKASALGHLSPESFKQIMKEIQKEEGVKGPALWKPVRVAITSGTSGPDLPLVIDILGREKVVAMVRHVLENYCNS